MKLHRFYYGDNELPRDFWMDDKNLFHQWTRVLRFQVGRELVLFNEHHEERLYRILKLGNDAVHLELVTELEPSLPRKDIYLCFSLLKKDKVDWVLQKCTELGVRHFIPLITERTEKTGFDVERALRIVIEAAEQCGRTDIPRVREPISLDSAIDELSSKMAIYYLDQSENSDVEEVTNCAVLVGPEGGWTDSEKELFNSKEVKRLSINDFTLRAETASVVASALLM